MPNDISAPLISSMGIWMMGPFSSVFFPPILDSFTTGSLCSLSPNQLSDKFIRVVYRDAINTMKIRGINFIISMFFINSISFSVSDRWLPWIGSGTYSYAQYCLSFVKDNGDGQLFFQNTKSKL